MALRTATSIFDSSGASSDAAADETAEELQHNIGAHIEGVLQRLQCEPNLEQFFTITGRRS